MYTTTTTNNNNDNYNHIYIYIYIYTHTRAHLDTKVIQHLYGPRSSTPPPAITPSPPIKSCPIKSP